MNILGDLERDWDAAKADLARMTGHGHPEPQPSFTPSQPSQPEVPVTTPQQPRLVDSLHAITGEIQGNYLVARLLEQGLGKMLTQPQAALVTAQVAEYEGQNAAIDQAHAQLAAQQHDDAQQQ